MPPPPAITTLEIQQQQLLLLQQQEQQLRLEQPPHQEQLLVPRLRNLPRETDDTIEIEYKYDSALYYPAYVPNTQTAPEPSTDANTEQSENIDLAQAGVEVVGVSSADFSGKAEELQ